MFILTITKFAREEKDTPVKTVAPKKKTLHIKRKSPSLSNAKTIYAFDSFDAFCDFCTFLNKSKYKDNLNKFAKKVALYEYNSNYYLMLTEVNTSSDMAKYICHIITEFARFVDNSDLFEKKIIEYGSAIIDKNAITTCTNYFV